MLFKISTLLAIAATLQTTLATPPACLLACVSKIEKASNCSGLNDLSCICSSQASKIEQCLNDICPNDNADDAIKAFKSSCSGFTSSSSSSESESASSTASSESESSSESQSASESESESASSTAESSAEQSSSAAGSASSSSSEAESSVESTGSESATVAAESTTAESSSVVAVVSTSTRNQTSSGSAPTSIAVVSSEGAGSKVALPLAALVGALLV
ncbi:SSR1 Covalently-linked cell wall protein 14 [Candida maltosa Xu316]|uniref:CFEM domain-containing protein n=1 Tax=Candida maltosa (strain Xu316) TaxID=1245528 RepID=M3JY84_CANMX|nr:hypothetical protein G210_2297 [Candida maltosa Xu316]